MLQGGDDIGGRGELVEAFAVLRITVFLPRTGSLQVFDSALLQGEEAVVLHLLDDLGEMRIRIFPGDGFALVREQLLDISGAELSQRDAVMPAEAMVRLAAATSRCEHPTASVMVL